MKTSTPIKIRKSKERGHASHGWLDSWFSFSFAGYYDPGQMGFRTLRVINEDKVAAGKGFGMHPHNNMEIVSYVVEGELEHKDSMGNGSVIKAGSLQRMTAGTGVTHSEFNPSKKQTTHLLQIWILPEKKGLTPSYQELNLNDSTAKDGLRLVAAPGKNADTLTIHQDVRLFFGRFKNAGHLDYALAKDRGAWVQMIKGEAQVLGGKLSAGDGAAIEDTATIPIDAQAGCEFLLFDLN